MLTLTTILPQKFVSKFAEVTLISRHRWFALALKVCTVGSNVKMELPNQVQNMIVSKILEIDTVNSYFV